VLLAQRRLLLRDHQGQFFTGEGRDVLPRAPTRIPVRLEELRLRPGARRCLVESICWR
jgi:hypothetical protein